MSDSAQDIEKDIARTRAELQATVDQLSDRLDPKALAAEAMDEAKIAAAEVRRRVTGDVRPLGEPAPTTTGWAVLGTAAALAALVVTTVVRKI